jgi:hypothetical protein
MFGTYLLHLYNTLIILQHDRYIEEIQILNSINLK